MMNPNKEYLKGMKCPNCGSLGPFWIAAEERGLLLMSDTGAQDRQETHVSWDSGSDCTCPQCSLKGEVHHFYDGAQFYVERGPGFIFQIPGDSDNSEEPMLVQAPSGLKYQDALSCVDKILRESALCFLATGNDDDYEFYTFLENQFAAAGFTLPAWGMVSKTWAEYLNEAENAA